MGWGDMSVNWTQQDKNGRQVTRRNEVKTPTLEDVYKRQAEMPAAISRA